MSRVHFQHHYGSKIIYKVLCYRELLPHVICILSESKRPHETKWTLIYQNMPRCEFFRLDLTCAWLPMTCTALVLTTTACQVIWFHIAWKLKKKKMVNLHAGNPSCNSCVDNEWNTILYLFSIYYVICRKCNRIGHTSNSFKFQTANYSVSPSNAHLGSNALVHPSLL